MPNITTTAGKPPKTQHPPKMMEARDMVLRFREAATQREKLKVIRTIRQRYPEIAENFAKIINNE